MSTLRRALLLVSAGLVIAVSAGCGGGGGGGREPSVEEIVRRTAERTAALESFHFRFEIENAPAGKAGLNLTFADGDLVVPNQLRAKVAGTFSGIPLRSELIFFRDQHYLKDPLTGRWRKLDAKTGPVAFFDPAKGVLSVIESAVQLERTGSGRVGGDDTYRLRGFVRDGAVTPILNNKPRGRLVPLELWVGQDDFVIRRIRLKGPIAADESEDIVRTVEVSQFDRPFTIEPPAGAE